MEQPKNIWRHGLEKTTNAQRALICDWLLHDQSISEVQARIARPPEKDGFGIQVPAAALKDVYSEIRPDHLRETLAGEQRIKDVLIQPGQNCEARVQPATLAAIQQKLFAAASSPVGDSTEIKTYFMLLIEQQKLDLASTRLAKNETSSSVMTEEEQRERMWRVLGYSEEEKARLRKELEEEYGELARK